jgi:hypothetical protein
VVQRSTFVLLFYSISLCYPHRTDQATEKKDSGIQVCSKLWLQELASRSKMSWLLGPLDKFPAWAHNFKYFIHLGWWCIIITDRAFPRNINHSFYEEL